MNECSHCQSKNESMWVIVDRMMKYVHFIPTPQKRGTEYLSKRQNYKKVQQTFHFLTLFLPNFILGQIWAKLFFYHFGDMAFKDDATLEKCAK